MTAVTACLLVCCCPAGGATLIFETELVKIDDH
jgi:hypothetical protein